MSVFHLSCNGLAPQWTKENSLQRFFFFLRCYAMYIILFCYRNILIFYIDLLFIYYLFILKDRVTNSERERKLIFHSLNHSPNVCNSQAKANIPGLHLGLPHGCRCLCTWATFACFRHTLGGNWVGSRGTWT